MLSIPDSEAYWQTLSELRERSKLRVKFFFHRHGTKLKFNRYETNTFEADLAVMKLSVSIQSGIRSLAECYESVPASLRNELT